MSYCFGQGVVTNLRDRQRRNLTSHPQDQNNITDRGDGAVTFIPASLLEDSAWRVKLNSGGVGERLNPAVDPMTINLSVPGTTNVRRFQDTCNFIISACRVLSLDMAARCPTGKSFHTYGWLAISNLTKPKG